MGKDIETFFRCWCGTTITGARFGSRFYCLACGRAWHLRNCGFKWWWPRKRRNPRWCARRFGMGMVRGKCGNCPRNGFARGAAALCRTGACRKFPRVRCPMASAGPA